MRCARAVHDLRQSSQCGCGASMCPTFSFGMCHARIAVRPGLLVAASGPRRADRRQDRSDGMGRCAARRRLPPHPAADPRAQPPRDRSLVQGHRARSGHRVPQPSAGARPAHPATLPARPQRQRRPRERLRRLRRRRPQRLQLHGRPVQRHRRQHDQQREPVQRRLGRPLDACGVRGRRGLVGRDAHPLAHRADAPGRRHDAHDRPGARPRGRRQQRAHGLAGDQLQRAALPQRTAQGRDSAVQPVAAGDHALRRRPRPTSMPARTSSGSRTASSSSAARSIRTSARSKATASSSISAPSRPSSATSARSSPRTRAISKCRSARSATRSS